MAARRSKRPSTAEVDTWRAALLAATPKRRVAAAKKLARVDAEGTRRALLEALDRATKRGERKTIAECLHYVVDRAVADLLITSDELALSPELIPPELLAELALDLGRSLGALSPSTLRRRLDKLGVFERDVTHGSVSGRSRWESARASLSTRVLDEPRARALHHEASLALLRWGDAAARASLIARHEHDPDAARAADVMIAWLSTDEAPLPPGLFERVERELTESVPVGPPVDASLARRAPRSELARVIEPFSRSERFRALGDECAKLWVADAPSDEALVAILDDPRRASAHVHAAARLIASGPDGARAALARSESFDEAGLRRLLTLLSPDVAFDALRDRVALTGPTTRLSRSLLATPSALRDARWLDLAASLSTLGREILVVMARDPKGVARGRALDLLGAAARRAKGRMDKRAAVYSLGQTAHPEATPYLLEALDDPDMSDGAPLICTALSEVGDTRAVPILLARQDRRYASFLHAAVERIRERYRRIHAEALSAALNDEDPLIADLASRASAGDDDAAVVLEDALRERGRL